MLQPDLGRANVYMLLSGEPVFAANFAAAAISPDALPLIVFAFDEKCHAEAAARRITNSNHGVVLAGRADEKFAVLKAGPKACADIICAAYAPAHRICVARAPDSY